MVGTLILIGKGKKEIGVIKEILTTKDKSLCGKTAEPNGLYLNKVYY
jgi:tRNA pseudouridine38-40 synthase